ncbi:Penicillin-binding protein 1A [Candidatus Fokinia solitaria]|uniref:peptidoglycan glycosyltransferase n=1 Tax=Candidatus Fokinia solitaria TaxID=1802984 RepID=A0A2U8BS47_9RICK|nr:PBP1A family penicillin-binding protein [Candidatus Fokinia solitaria]AWD33186.1 Penicillin-binding protein 1A [Candidatus Fokinia solitaria]
MSNNSKRRRIVHKKHFLRLLVRLLINRINNISLYGIIWYFLCFSISFLVAVVAISSLRFMINLPNYEILVNYEPSSVTRVYDVEGNVIGEQAIEYRIPVSFDDIPKVVIDAFLAAEDKSFFEHDGIDFTGIMRALIQTVFRVGKGKTPVGGSTITQQIIKSILIGSEQTISRKVKEAILAYKISSIIDKDTLMELYLNYIFLGNNSYGIVAAARSYFNKNLTELSLQEAALLAALPKAPTKLNPFHNQEYALTRRNWVIQRMYRENFITKSQATAAINTPITLVSPSKNKASSAMYYSEYGNQVLEEAKVAYGTDTINESGLVIYSNMEADIQRACVDALNKGIEKYSAENGKWLNIIDHISDYDESSPKLEKIALLRNLRAKFLRDDEVVHDDNVISIGVIDGKTSTNLSILALDSTVFTINYSKDHNVKDTSFRIGDVLLISKDRKNEYAPYKIPQVNGAMVVLERFTGKVLAFSGGYKNPLLQHDYFNRAFFAKRQPGSLMKTLIYLSALREGYTLSSILSDEPISLDAGDGTVWSPKNWDNKFIGDISLLDAFALSRNTVTVKLLMQLGLPRVVALCKQFGLYDNEIDYSRIGYSFALGTLETTLLKITNAYNIIASHGYKVSPQLINAIYDKAGNVIQQNEYISTNELYTRSISNIADSDSKDYEPLYDASFQQVIEKDTALQMLTLLQYATKERFQNSKLSNAGGKTGTTNESKDVFFIGCGDRYTVGIYIGFDTPKTLGKNIYGRNTALPIFVDFMEKVLPNDTLSLGYEPFILHFTS